jgi:hypothetical protein
MSTVRVVAKQLQQILLKNEGILPGGVTTEAPIASCGSCTTSEGAALSVWIRARLVAEGATAAREKSCQSNVRDKSRRRCEV